jgi:hypothetical protein
LRFFTTTWSKLQESHSRNPRRFWLQAIYCLCLAYILIVWRAIWTPDLLFFMFLLLFAVYGQGKQVVVNFGPFLILLLAYDSLRGFAPYVDKHVHYATMINFDRWVGHGQLPTVWLQHLLYHGHLDWYDYYFYILYMCHFLTPLLVAIAIWRHRRQHYNRYVFSFLLLSYAGFVTFLLFPAAPPWMASQMGYIPHIQKISTDIWAAMGVHNYTAIYDKLSPNLVAAVPSLHAAYPTLMVLFITRAFGWRWGLASLWYPISLWIGVIYLGEHYLFDVTLGITYAVTSFALTNLLFNRYGQRARLLQERLRARRYRQPAVTATAVD